MFTLYYYPGNANLAAHVLLEEVGAPHELVRVDREHQGHSSPEYLRLNPNGKIPVLVHDGAVLYEAAALCLYLVDLYPDAGLAPAPGTAERGEFYKWMAWLTNTLQAELIIFTYPDRYTTDAGGADGVKAAAAARLGRLFDQLETVLGTRQWLAGDHYTACDPFLLMVSRWGRRLDTPPATRPALTACLDRILARPAVQRAFRAEGLEPDWRN